jgi:hypothetical protein
VHLETKRRALQKKEKEEVVKRRMRQNLKLQKGIERLLVKKKMKEKKKKKKKRREWCSWFRGRWDDERCENESRGEGCNPTTRDTEWATR